MVSTLITKKQKALLQKQAQKHWKKAQVKFNAANRKVKAYVKANPKRAVMIAAGVAAALGAAMLLKKKK